MTMTPDPKFLDVVVTTAGKYVLQFENYLKGSNQLNTLNTWEHLKKGFFDEIEGLEKTGSWIMIVTGKHTFPQSYLLRLKI